MPTVEEECGLLASGHQVIAGLDEAGRGCWAGPVVAAAVVLGQAVLATPLLLAGVNDSKQLTAAQRERCATLITSIVDGVGVGVVPAYLIDSFGIIAATRLAMELALLELPQQPDALLVDALALPGYPVPQRALVRGDSTSLSIAAASIIAKTTRDRLMTQLDSHYPGFGFGRHKGYGTAAHARAIAQQCVTSLHRRSFRPLWNVHKTEILHES